MLERFWVVKGVSIGDEFLIGDKPITDPQRFPDLGTLISNFLPNIYVLAGIILFLLLIAGGYGIIMGSGSGDSNQVGKGQKAVTSAIVGFVLIFASYWIIQIIQVLTGMEILESGI